jgi:hypothetical protein
MCPPTPGTVTSFGTVGLVCALASCRLLEPEPLIRRTRTHLRSSSNAASTMQPREVAKASEVFVVHLACGEGLFESVPLHPVDHPGLQGARPRMPDVADGDRDAVKLIGRFLGGVDPPGFVPFNNHIIVDADVVNRRRQEVRTTIVVDQIAGQHHDGPTARCEVERADVGEDRSGAFHVSEVGQHLGVVVDARDLVIERKEVAVTRPVPQPSSRIGEPGGTAAWMSAASSCPGSVIVNWSGCFWKVGSQSPV